jgi:apolipoprotein N-acyltransferase
LAGEHAATFWIALINGLLAAAVVRGRARRDHARAREAGVLDEHETVGRRAVWPFGAAALLVAAVPLALPMVARGPGPAEASSGRTLRVALVQTSIPQSVREDAEAGAREMAAALDRLLPTVAPSSADLIVLPETAFLLPLESAEGRPYLEAVRAHAHRLGAPFLVGALGVDAHSSGERRRNVYNSVFLIDAGGVRGRYDKRHLVPGVERTPLLPARLAAAVGDTASYAMGARRTLIASTPVGELTVGLLICFETAFGALARWHVRAGAQLLVNVTNDAWFGEGMLGAGARAQHEAHLILRAVENGVPVVRSANGGVSMVVDSRGRMVRSGAAGEELAWVEPVRVGAAGPTGPRLGAVVGPLCVLAVAFLVLVGVVVTRVEPGRDPSRTLR